MQKLYYYVWMYCIFNQICYEVHKNVNYQAKMLIFLCENIFFDENILL